MKKILCFSTLLATVLFASSCGNKKQTPEVDLAAQAALTEALTHELDSIINIVNDMYYMPFFTQIRTGQISLTPQEKKVLPEYLLPLSKAKTLQTLEEKNIAMVIYIADRGIMKLYAQSLEEYDAVIMQLAAETNAQNFIKNGLEADLTNPKASEMLAARIKNQYRIESENGTSNLYVARVLTLFTENMYLLAQNPDKFLAGFSDEDAVNIAHRLAVVSELATKIGLIYPEMKGLDEGFKTLNPISNVKTQKELVDAIKATTPQITALRNSLLK